MQEQADEAPDEAADAAPPSEAQEQSGREQFELTRHLPIQGPRYLDIPIDQIRRNPRNPRTVFDEDALVELTHSIREFGLLQPVVVRDVPGGGYELVMGERRWQAAQRAGHTTIPAIVRRTEDADLLRDALLENIHRANLNPLGRGGRLPAAARGVRRHPGGARLTARPQPAGHLQHHPAAAVSRCRCSAGSRPACCLPGTPGRCSRCPIPDDQEQLAARIVAEGLSVRGAEEAVTLLAGRPAPRRRNSSNKRVIPGLDDLAVTLSDAFDTRVKLELGRTKGRIVVEFATQEDLRRIVTVMAPHAMNTLVLGNENDDRETDLGDPGTPGRTVTVTHRPERIGRKTRIVATQQISHRLIRSGQSERLIARSTRPA